MDLWFRQKKILFSLGLCEEKTHWNTTNNSREPKYGKIEFEILTDEKVLRIKAPYLFTDRQAIGGVMIGTGNGGGYLSGHTYADYERKGCDFYEFCTRTNRYLGYKGTELDACRPWIKKVSRY